MKVATIVMALGLLLWSASSVDAQTVTGRLEASYYQEEYQQHIYHAAWWSLDVASTAEPHYGLVVDLYYNKVQAAMVALLVCQSPNYGQEEPLIIGNVLVREHFMRIENDVWANASCRIGLFAGSSDGAVISYRMRVTGMAGQRPGKSESPFGQASAAAAFSSGYQMGSYNVEQMVNRVLSAALSGE